MEKRTEHELTAQKPSAQNSTALITNELESFLKALHRTFGARRLSLLEKRRERDRKFKDGETLHQLESTRSVRQAQWQVTSTPLDLQCRTVEITGPAEPKMIINALNSAANVFMADLEDALAPAWSRILEGHLALNQAARKSLSFENEGKTYRLNEKLATLIVRPRGLHMTESHFSVDKEAISASLFDFGTYLFHNAEVLLSKGTGPYFYLAKMESHLEARFWADVFEFSENYLGLRPESIKATVLIETAPAAFEMEEILFELRKYIVGLNAGRWDYIFSWIKKFHHRKDHVFPDRQQVTMNVPFMKAYCERIVEVCHKRGAHAMGGMSAFIPNRKEPEVTAQALIKVREDKTREVSMGFDGTWVAHPDLISVAREEFEKILGDNSNQKNRIALGPSNDTELSDIHIPNASVSEAGVRSNLFVALVYLDNWINGTGAVAIHNLMEDAATAEISRSQIWQWLQHRVQLKDGFTLEKAHIEKWLKEEADKAAAQGLLRTRDLSERALAELILNSEFPEFLTLKCEHLINRGIH